MLDHGPGSRAALLILTVTGIASAGPTAPPLRSPTTKSAEASKAEVPITVTTPVVKGPSAWSCMLSWSASVTNTNSADYGDVLQAYFVADGKDVGGAGGIPLRVPKGETKEGGSAFERLGTRNVTPTHIRVILGQGSAPNFKILASSVMVPIPPVPPIGTSLVADANGSGTSFSASLRNQLELAYPGEDLTLKTSSAPSSAGPWTPAGTPLSGLGCINAKAESRALAGSKPADHRFIRIEVAQTTYTGPNKPVTTTVLEKIVDLAPPRFAAPKLRATDVKR